MSLRHQFLHQLLIRDDDWRCDHPASNFVI